jgi:hypothetical protein
MGLGSVGGETALKGPRLLALTLGNPAQPCPPARPRSAALSAAADARTQPRTQQPPRCGCEPLPAERVTPSTMPGRRGDRWAEPERSEQDKALNWPYVGTRSFVQPPKRGPTIGRAHELRARARPPTPFYRHEQVNVV